MSDSTRLAGIVALLLSAGAGTRLPAQSLLEQFSYDNLKLSGIQVDLGVLGSSELRGAVVGGVRLDYGRFAPNVRLLLGLSYFRSEFDHGATTRFEQRLKNFVIDPSGDDTIKVGRIFWSDLTADVDLQYVLPQGRGVTSYIGFGVGVHVRNGSGSAINGTFIEDALDDIAAAANVSLGLEVAAGPRWRIALDSRGVLSSGLSTASLRAGLMYRIGAMGGGGGRTP